MSAIIRKNGDIHYNLLTDSHEDLVAINNLRDDKEGNFARVEFYPDSRFDLDKPEKYILHIDEEITPYWLDDEAKTKAADKLRLTISGIIISGTTAMLCGGVHILASDAKVSVVKHSRIVVMLGTSRVGEMLGTSRVGKMLGNSQVGKMLGTSRVGEMLGTSQVGEMLGTSQVGEMRDTSRVGKMLGTSRVGKMWNTSRVGEMQGTSQVGEMWEDSQVGEMLGTSQVGKMLGRLAGWQDAGTTRRLFFP